MIFFLFFFYEKNIYAKQYICDQWKPKQVNMKIAKVSRELSYDTNNMMHAAAALKPCIACTVHAVPGTSTRAARSPSRVAILNAWLADSVMALALNAWLADSVMDVPGPIKRSKRSIVDYFLQSYYTSSSEREPPEVSQEQSGAGYFFFWTRFDNLDFHV